MSRLILLSEWARSEFGDPIPSKSTLNKYAKNGMIFPLPCRVGKSWRVEADARFTGLTTEPVIKKSRSPITQKDFRRWLDLENTT
ncbi:excisionase [Citrobacter portucalensis]|uniref:excisionase n=1 Tax=Citrobacter portucalensis TaxID=1639133 RepID=UPI00397A84EA